MTQPNESIKSVFSTLKWFLLLIPPIIGYLILRTCSATMDIIPIFLIGFCLILSPLVLFAGFVIHTIISFIERKLKEISQKKQ